MARSIKFVSTKRFSSARKLHLAVLFAGSAAVPLVGLMTEPASAATTNLYWDLNGNTVGGSLAATPGFAAGTWDTSTAQWSSNTTGTVASTVWTNAGATTAVFAAGTDVTGQYTVSSASNINLAGITREEGTVTVSFTGILTFSGSPSGGLAINAGTSGSGNLNLNAPFDGSPTGVLTKTGTGLLALSTTQSTYHGTYIVSAGSIAFFSDKVIGTDLAGPVPALFTLNGGNIRTNNNVVGGVAFGADRGITLGNNGGGFDGANGLTWAGAITGAGPLKIAGSGNVTLTNTNNNYTGITQFSGAGGNLFLTATGEMPTTTSLSLTAAGTLNLVGIDQTVQEISGSDSGALIAVGSNTLTFNPVSDSFPGSFSGAIASKIIMNGGGLQKLTGASTGFLGEFDVNGGTVEINNNDVFGLGKLEINNDVVLDQNGGSATRTQHNPTVDVFGNITVNDVFMASPNTIAFSGGVMNLQAANRTFFVGNATGGLGGPVSFTIGDPIGDNGAGYGFTKTGNGTLNLTSSANSYSGDTILSAGTVTINQTIATPFGTGGTLQLAGGTLSSTGNRAGVVANPINLTASSAITTTSTAGTVLFEFSGPLSGTNGTLTLRNDAPTGTGALNVRFSGSGFNFPQPIVIAAGTGTGPGTTVIVGFNGTGTAQTFSGAISGPGSLLRSVSSGSGGDTILSGANTYQGGTNLNNGGLGIGIDSVVDLSGNVISGALGIGTLTASSSAGHIFAAGGSHTLGNTIALTNNLGVIGTNDLTLAGTISGAGSLNLGLTGATLSLNNSTADSTFTSVTGAGNLSKDGTNTVNVNFVRTTGGLAANGGTLKINPSTSGGGTSVVTTLAAPTGKLDLNDNKLVVTGGSVGAFNASNPGAYDGVTGLVANGRHNGAWDQPGVITSQSAALTANGALTTLAVAAASDVKDFSVATTASFGGQTVHATDTLVMYTWNGDANLDGKVNADDYFQIDSHYGTTVDAAKSFHNGDFNYDGQVNGDDYALIDAAFAGQSGVFPSAPGLAGVSAVPEPASLAGVVIAVALSLKRRRRV